MSFHDEAASRAFTMGKTKEEFEIAAQKHANASWLFAIVAAAVWYFFGWGWALIPVAICLAMVVQSVSATKIAIQLERLSSKN